MGSRGHSYALPFPVASSGVARPKARGPIMRLNQIQASPHVSFVFQHCAGTQVVKFEIWYRKRRTHMISQCSLHNAPIFRLLLKVAVNGTHQCESLNFCGAYRPNLHFLVSHIQCTWMFNPGMFRSRQPHKSSHQSASETQTTMLARAYTPTYEPAGAAIFYVVSIIYEIRYLVAKHFPMEKESHERET